MNVAEIKGRIISAAMARHRAQARLEAAVGPGNKLQRERRKQYRVINAAEKALAEATAQLEVMSAERETTITGLDRVAFDVIDGPAW